MNEEEAREGGNREFMRLEHMTISDPWSSHYFLVGSF